MQPQPDGSPGDVPNARTSGSGWTAPNWVPALRHSRQTGNSPDTTASAYDGRPG